MGIDCFKAAFGVKDGCPVREYDLQVISPFLQTGMGQKVLKAPLENGQFMGRREYKGGCRDVSRCVHVDDDDPFFLAYLRKGIFHEGAAVKGPVRQALLGVEMTQGRIVEAVI